MAMQINISKTDFNALVMLIDKCTAIVKEKQPTTKEYNYARRLSLIKKKMVRSHERAERANH